jgi:hypothetical protein
MATSRELFEEVGSAEELGGGAYFWVYLSPEHETSKVVKDWTVTLTQGDWSASISSDQNPPILKRPDRSGEFGVRVTWRNPPTDVIVELKPSPGSEPGVRCDSGCAAMIGIVAGEGEQMPTYWTVSDAWCRDAADGG